MALELLLRAGFIYTDEEDVSASQVVQAFNVDKPGELLRRINGLATGQILRGAVIVLPEHDGECGPIGLPLHGHDVAFSVGVVLGVVAGADHWWRGYEIVSVCRGGESRKHGSESQRSEAEKTAW